jgi:hypothetical protein
MADISSRRWNPNSPGKLRYVGGACKRGEEPTEDELPGLFWYSGFGMGSLYLPDGSILWCCTTEAREECKARGLDFRFQDSFAFFQATYLGD